MPADRATHPQVSPAPILTVRDLCTWYYSSEGLVRAVDGVNFDVHAGRTLGIVGESGCGKSVTARSILRIVEKPGKIVRGSIHLHPAHGQGASRDLVKLVADGPEMREIQGGDIALVFQEPMTSFSPVHTVGNQIIETIQLHDRSVTKAMARDRAIELLQMVGIPRAERRVDEFAYQLSGGLRQRAMIALALACDPRLLIADEPTTALDVTTQAQILELLRRLQAERGMAIMLITHNLGVIAEMADDVAVMYLGRVVEQASVRDLFRTPQHPYTRALLRSIPSLHSPPRQPLATIEGSVPHPLNRPTGCPFHPRCEVAIAGTCDTHVPELLPVGPGPTPTLVSCFQHHPVGASGSREVR
ncbi:MAG: ABC transporter ATP-binding protein [Chloroflexota bacterium]|jgi:oligopeptide/dipeptide ABC transporter ATP-binding protein|nr:ABC transporter ATP-binding protein [Chloroflexota bacterium]